MIPKRIKKSGLFLIIVLSSLSLVAQSKKNAGISNEVSRPKNLSDSALVDLVQKKTFAYFWDFAHPVSGMARERSNRSFDYGDEVVTTGGTGFGIMSVIV